MEADTFFQETQKMMRIIRRRGLHKNINTVLSVREDVDLIPLEAFLLYFEDCETWPTHLMERDSTFRRLLEIEGIFVVGQI